MEAEREFKQDVEREADRAVEQPREHLTRLLGERPGEALPAERAAWNQAARAVESFCIPYEVDRSEPSALPSRPDPADTSWTQAREWRQADEQVLDALEHLGIAEQGCSYPTKIARALENDLGCEI